MPRPKLRQVAAGPGLPQNPPPLAAAPNPPPLAAAPNPSPLAELYGRWTLDSVAEAGVAVGHDSMKRSRFYRAVPANVVAILTQLRTRTGYDPDWLNTAQRTSVYMPLFGSQDNKTGADRTSAFHQAATTLRDAAVAFSERVFNTGEPMLRQAFADAAIGFQGYLNTQQGTLVAEARRQTGLIFNSAATTLRTAEVAQTFGGLPPAGGAQWPFGLPGDGDGALLMEEVTRTLQPAAGSQVTMQQFLVLQRIAYQGAATITAIQGNWHAPGETQQRRDSVISYAYGWATALRALAK